jgi:hypothetical protein
MSGERFERLFSEGFNERVDKAMERLHQEHPDLADLVSRAGQPLRQFDDLFSEGFNERVDQALAETLRQE